MRELFIYYRSPVANAQALQTAALGMQAQLQARHPSLQARLLRRLEAVDGLHTWMETYAAPISPGGVTEALAREIEAAALSALSPWIAGGRHTEGFDLCAW